MILIEIENYGEKNVREGVNMGKEIFGIRLVMDCSDWSQQGEVWFLCSPNIIKFKSWVIKKL